ncbi:MYO5 [Mytilus coruscus]|uniref:MYO5 n=1 Tax=Mytilus coruscus TaxID=42192 RepID=A0A6J8A9W4_MYTCO|nr:MYO5 [Mytilus coruscus]
MTDIEKSCCICRCCKWICRRIEYIFCCLCCRPFCWLSRQSRIVKRTCSRYYGRLSGYDQLEGTVGKGKYPASQAECRQEIDKLNGEVENLTWRLQDKNNEIKDLKQEKDVALSRLSEMMGSKLQDSNPAIADLNDQNRPMKLAEQFTEFIGILLHILKEINEECVNDSSLQLSGLKKAFQCLPGDDCKEYFKMFKDVLKSQATKYLPLICRKLFDIESNCKTVQKFKTVCQPYIELCVKICYLSAVQDPPMFLDFEPNDTFDRSTFQRVHCSRFKSRLFGLACTAYSGRWRNSFQRCGTAHKGIG